MASSKTPSKRPKGRASVTPKGRTSVTPPRASKRPAEDALATLRSGLEAMRETLLTAAANLDAFTRDEFVPSDPRRKTLLDLHAVLVKAAGQGARLPTSPARKGRATLDIVQLTDTVQSLRPGAPRDYPEVFVISPVPFSRFPKR